MPNADLDPYACDCGWLARAANDPSVPIGFDSTTNEYYVEMRGSVDGRMLLRFCPWCGGDAPVSKSDELFEPIAPEDQLKIHQLSNELRTKADVVAKWAPPDEEVRGGYGAPESAREGARTVLLDIMRYNNIVATAVVDVIVRTDDTVNISSMPRVRSPHEG